MFDDFKVRFCFKVDYTLAMHFVRDFVSALLIYAITKEIMFSLGLSVGINLAWEWQDGLHNDGFNPFDLAAGLFGTLLYYIVWGL